MNHLAMQIWKGCIEHQIFLTARSVESGSGQRVKNNKGPLLMDAPPIIAFIDPGEDGSPKSEHVCIPSYTLTLTLVQLKAGPSSKNNRCICSRLESFSGV